MTTLSTSKPQPNTEVDAAALSSNFTAIEAVVNGNLDTSNWGTGKVFPINKLQQGGANTGDALVWNGSDWGPATPVTTGYGTALPGSPTDGQEYVLVDSSTAPTYAWRFRYDTEVSDANKWVFVGGSAPIILIETQQSLQTSTYSDLGTVGPSWTVPRSGVYNIDFGCAIRDDAAEAAWAALKIGASATQDADAIKYGQSTSTPNTHSLARRKQFTLTASTVVKMQYRNAAAAPAYFGDRWISPIPVRVA